MLYLYRYKVYLIGKLQGALNGGGLEKQAGIVNYEETVHCIIVIKAKRSRTKNICGI